jgi:osmoprotectant transport system permease protein
VSTSAQVCSRWRTRCAPLLCLLALLPACARETRPQVVVGSKKFTESVVLGELLAQLARDAGARVVHRSELGGSRVLFEALQAGQVDLYPEYTGTLREELLADEDVRTPEALATALGRRGLRMSAPLGFDNTYAIGVRRETAERLGLRTLSDLARHPELRLGFSNEFMARADGWPALRRRYGLTHADVRGLDHDLAYRGLESGALDATDLYSTDAEVRRYDLVVLEDDLHHFPDYQAVVLSRADLAQRAPEVVKALSRIQGRISAQEMVEMNARARLEHEPPGRVAADLLARELGVHSEVREAGWGVRVARATREHLALVGVSLGAAILVAIPLGVLAARRRRVGQVVLAGVGLVQTVPSLALLVFMIPLLGIGTWPAVVALFLYALLPMVRATHAGLTGLPADVREAAEALGLPPGARLRLVELPMASGAILSGIKTAAVITVGTATLGALVGAGGYGQPILTGIRLADVGLILEGAVPAALLALAVQGGFELAERWLVPRGLRLGGGER